MAAESVLKAVAAYLDSLPRYGIHASRAILFGSHARGSADEWSDIDLLVIAPEFDAPHGIEIVKRLWLATADIDLRIEPIPCGEAEWRNDDGRPILECARREGIMVDRFGVRPAA